MNSLFEQIKSWKGALVSILIIISIIFRTTLTTFGEKLLSEYLKDYYPALFITFLVVIIDSFNRIINKLNSLLIQDEALGTLPEVVSTIKNHSSKFSSNPLVNHMKDQILKEVADQINDIGGITHNHKLEVNDEYKRVQYIRHLFNSHPGKKIIAVTYDKRDYFLNFWGGLQLSKLIQANIIAAQQAEITRYFIFSQEDFMKNPEKIELYDTINESLTGIKNIHNHRIWEHEIDEIFPNNFLKRSYLLIDDYITTEIKDGQLDGYLAFGHQGSIDDLKKRTNKLNKVLENNHSKT